MPSTLTYPGVYVEEVPSGVHTIVGVATSIAAFVGRTARGPENEATTITSYADFERTFGGLDVHSPVSFAVRDFYVNGGAQAVIVRLSNGASKFALTLGTAFTLEAASSGTWGQYLRGQIDFDVPADVIKAAGLTDADKHKVFNLTIRESAPGGASEVFKAVTTEDKPRRLDRVLAKQSSLVKWKGDFKPADLANELHNAAGKPIGDAVTAAQGDWQATADAFKKGRVDAAAGALMGGAVALAALEAKVGEKEDAVAKATATAAGAASDGADLQFQDYFPVGGQANKHGVFALEKVDLFNLLCLPSTDDTTYPLLLSDAASYCEKRRAMLIVDAPTSATWATVSQARDSFTDPTATGFPGIKSRNAAIYFPRVKYSNPLKDNQLEEFAPCGVIAGVYAKTDTTRGVWKAPAGTETSLVGVQELAVKLTDNENGLLNPLGINCLRAFPAAGRVVWGARTLRGNDQLADEYKYVPVRRLALFIEESLYRGTQWAVFEPNDEPLWSSLRLNVGAFMHDLFRQGAFQGQTPSAAYKVKCDNETTTQSDINRGIVNVLVAFAPLKPAEFVVLRIQQLAGQIET
jgi:uncharacterized protein